jgi:alpha-glucosidase (family GH31 glycosyl hydrolase)
LLVSPVVEQGQTSKRVYLPAGKWIDWSTGKTYEGGQTIDVPVDAKTWHDIPLFIRDGAIIPTQPVMDYVGQHPVTTVTVQVFPSDRATHFDYYDDDGETYAYEKGVYFLQPMSTRKGKGAIDFTLGATKGTYEPALRWYLLAVHGGTAHSVLANGKSVPPASTLDALKASPGEGWVGGHDRYGAVTWVKLAAGTPVELRVGTVTP